MWMRRIVFGLLVLCYVGALAIYFGSDRGFRAIFPQYQLSANASCRASIFIGAWGCLESDSVVQPNQVDESEYIAQSKYT